MADYSITEMLSFLYPYFLASLPSPIIKKKKEEVKCVVAVIFSFDAFSYKTSPLISGHSFLPRHLLPSLLPLPRLELVSLDDLCGGGKWAKSCGSK